MTPICATGEISISHVEIVENKRVRKSMDVKERGYKNFVIFNWLS